MLSIITINLNNKPGLLKTSASVASQTFQDIEYIIIDGGSTDGSKELLQELNADFYISEKDCGPYDAMNKGVQVAKGKWLMFLNSGDYLLHDKVLEQAFAKISPNLADVFYGDIEIEITDGSQAIHYSEHLTMAYWYSANINHQAAFYKRDLFEELGLYDLEYKLAADQAFNVKAFMYGKRFCHLGFPMVFYDVSGMSSKNFEKYKEEMKAAYDRQVPPELKRIVFEHRELKTQSKQSLMKWAARINNWYQQTEMARKRRTGK